MNKQRIVRFGSGKVGIACCMQGDVPVIAIIEHEKPYAIGETTRTFPGEIPAQELTDRNAIILEFPEYKSLDVLLYEVAGLWMRKKEKEWSISGDPAGMKEKEGGK